MARGKTGLLEEKLEILLVKKEITNLEYYLPKDVLFHPYLQLKCIVHPPFIFGRHFKRFKVHQSNEKAHTAQAIAAYLAAFKKESHL